MVRILRWPPFEYWTPLAFPAVESPPSTTYGCPFPYRSANDGVEKPLSAVKNG